MKPLPNDLKFTNTHEWLKEENEYYVIGITDHAQEKLGDMVFVDLPELGTSYEAGDVLGVVESVKAAADFYTPIKGTVVGVNDKARENPALVNSNPYEEGWLVKLRPEQDSLLGIDLLNSDQYLALIRED